MMDDAAKTLWTEAFNTVTGVLMLCIYILNTRSLMLSVLSETTGFIF